MQQSHLPTTSTPTATMRGRHRQDGPDKVSVGCWTKVIPARHGLPSGHARHDGSQNTQSVAS